MALTLSGIAKLRDAAVVLRETKGFAYLPIMVPHEVAGRDAIDELRSASAIDDALWHQVSWPQLDANEVSSSSPPSQRTLKEQRVELLQTFDSIVTSGTGLEHTIVLDASLSTRHTLALELDHAGLPGLQIYGAMNIDALATAGLLDRQRLALGRPAAGGARGMGRMPLRQAQERPRTARPRRRPGHSTASRSPR